MRLIYIIFLLVVSLLISMSTNAQIENKANIDSLQKCLQVDRVKAQKIAEVLLLHANNSTKAIKQQTLIKEITKEINVSLEERDKVLKMILTEDEYKKFQFLIMMRDKKRFESKKLKTTL